MTLSTVAISLAGLLILLAFVQLPYIFGFCRALWAPRAVPLADNECPRATIILCLRGADPFLHRCLEGLFAQDYPGHDIRVIVDSTVDPAWKMMEEICQRHPQASVRVEALRDPPTTCSLVNASVVQVLRSLDPACEVVAILDADVVPHPTWLRELVTPIARDGYGVAAGNRWYLPEVVSWGSLVRYLWNAGAVVQMYWNDYTWGGSVAVQRKVLDNQEFLATWLKAFAFDTTIHREVRRLGLKIAFVPSILMPNRETCDLPSFFPWVQRQLLLSKLYHPQWPVVIGHGLLTTAALVVAIVGCAVAWFAGSASSAIWLGGALLVYLLTMVVSLTTLERAARKVLRDRGEPTNWINAKVGFMLLLALPLTQVVFAAALIYAALLRNVSWRGIDYRIDGPYCVQMREYSPYRPANTDPDALTSL